MLLNVCPHLLAKQMGGSILPVLNDTVLGCVHYAVFLKIKIKIFKPKFFSQENVFVMTCPEDMF